MQEWKPGAAEVIGRRRLEGWGYAGLGAIVRLIAINLATPDSLEDVTPASMGGRAAWADFFSTLGITLVVVGVGTVLLATYFDLKLTAERRSESPAP